MKIALVGYGKMGKEIEQILIARGHTISLIIDVNNTADLDADHLRDIDVAIEFTTPQTAYGNIVKCIEAGVPVVCGTTAWLDKLPEVEQLCKTKQGAFFYASNYSIGVNIFFEINRYLAELMNRFGEYDVTIEETHHTQKKDAPSGTAKLLLSAVNPDGTHPTVFGREGFTPRTAGEIGVHAVRGGTVAGVHTVSFFGDEEELSLTHRAESRRIFAIGALKTAEKLKDAPVGLHTLDELLFARR